MSQNSANHAADWKLHMFKQRFGDFLARFLAVFVKVLDVVVRIRVIPLKGNHFGHFVAGPYYYLIRKQELVKRSHDIVFWHGSVTNVDAEKIWLRQIPSLARPKRDVTIRIAKSLHKRWLSMPSMSNHAVNIESQEFLSHRGVNAGLPRNLLIDEEFNDIRDAMNRLGIDLDLPVALLHVRDNSYDVALGKKRVQNWRNSRVEAFQSSVNFLRDRNFQVVSIGNEPSSRLGLEGVVEYHSSELRTPLRDFTIGSVATILVGTEGGPTNLARVFRIPSLFVDGIVRAPIGTDCNFVMHTLKNWRVQGSLISHSNCWSEATLPVKLHHGCQLINDEELLERGIEFEGNDADTILEATKDFLNASNDLVSQGALRRDEYQLGFWRIFNQHFHGRPRCEFSGSLMAPSFLKRNPHWLV